MRVQVRSLVWWVLLIAVVLCVLIFGYLSYREPTKNPPFAIELNTDKVTPNDRFDPDIANLEKYRNVTVYSANGSRVVLNAAEHPILFEAYWCPHCQRTLVALETNRSAVHEMPTIVSMGFVQGTTLSEAKRITKLELQSLQLSNLKVYYLLSPDASRFIPNGYPALVYPYRQQLYILSGEHTFGIWKRALNGA